LIASSRTRRIRISEPGDEPSAKTAGAAAVQSAHSAEWVLAAMVVAGALAVGFLLSKDGYLGNPFFFRKDQTLMDWFSTAYWAHQPVGAYRDWRSVYPPISFLFLDVFSQAHCYARSVEYARSCDAVGLVGPPFMAVIGFVCALLAFRAERLPGAFLRALALGLSSSMLYGVERGNLIVATFPFFVLGFSRLLRTGWLRVVCAAIAINFKPYLLLAAVGWLSRRRWAWLMTLFAVGGGVYLVSWGAFGAGSPLELLRNMAAPLTVPGKAGLDLIEFSSSYDSLLIVLLSPGQFPFHPPAQLVTGFRLGVFLVLTVGWVGWWVCCLGAARRPSVVTSQRLAAISFAVMFSICTPGGYSVMFLIFLVFLEKWSGMGKIIALTSAYLWCIPYDFPLLNLGLHTSYSFLGDRMVSQTTSISLGELLRPAFILAIEFGLIGSSLAQLLSDWRAQAQAAPTQPAPHSRRGLREETRAVA
jgi:hypothetical protein